MTYETNNLSVLWQSVLLQKHKRACLQSLPRPRFGFRPGSFTAIYFTCYAVATGAIIAVMLWRGLI